MAATKESKGIGARIRAARKAAGFTQAELAEAVGVEPESINRIENAKLSPSRGTLQKVAKALGVKLTDLLDDDAGVQVPKPVLTPARRRLLRLVDGLTDDQVEVLARAVEHLLRLGHERPPRRKS
jgi:transcriptional regulator with XRE-family HTH domain